MAKPNPRQYQTQQVHYLRFDVNYNDTSVSTGILKGTLPAGAIITSSSVLITTAFNAGTTNVLTVGGNSSSYNDIVASGDVDETATGITNAIKPTSSSLGKLAADRDIYVMYAQTGTAASAGAATVIIHFIVNNDG
jgi:hypothetical protein